MRNIPYDADAESLKEHFSTFGTVKYALPVVDKETGLAKVPRLWHLLKKTLIWTVLTMLQLLHLLLC